MEKQDDLRVSQPEEKTLDAAEEEPVETPTQGEVVPLEELAGVGFGGGGGEAPVFDKVTKVKVKEVAVKKGRQDDSKDYESLYIQAVFVGPEGREFWENYGGLRKYTREDGSVNLWTGSDSFAGKLRALAQDTFGEEETETIVGIVKSLEGCDVGIKTVDAPKFGGGSGRKNEIKQIYLKSDSADKAAAEAVKSGAKSAADYM